MLFYYGIVEFMFTWWMETSFMNVHTGKITLTFWINILNIHIATNVYDFGVP